MKFSEVLEGLAQFYELSQKGGALTLEQSYNIKKSLVSLQKDGLDTEDRDSKLSHLVTSVRLGQSCGCYTSNDVVTYFNLMTELEKCLGDSK